VSQWRALFIPLRDLNPRRRFPVVTVVLIVINTGLFLLGLALGEDGRRVLVLTGGAIPFEVTHLVDLPPANLTPPPWGVLTSMFLHAGVLHLVGNMWFLWLFGDNVEDALGPARFSAFYFFTGIAGALAQCFAMPGSRLPMIGASGAVAGMLGAYVVLFPRARIVTFVFLIVFIDRVAVPAWFFLGAWLVGQFFLGDDSNVAWIAHVGGFLSGAGTVRLLARR